MIKFGEAPFLECSSHGDRRFCAFCARLSVFGYKNVMYRGASIEDIYQGAKVFPGGLTGLRWQESKGRTDCVNQHEVRALYSLLWDAYIMECPELLKVLRAASGLSDMFGQPGHACQAEELWRIRNYGRKKHEEVAREDDHRRG